MSLSNVTTGIKGKIVPNTRKKMSLSSDHVLWVSSRGIPRSRSSEEG